MEEYTKENQMTKINMIAAVDEAFAIGYENHLLYHLSQDLMQFREKTDGKCIIMGRKTLESMPEGRPLANRRNIVLSSTMQICSGAEVYHNSDDIRRAIQCEEEAWVIGGESIYKLFLPYADAIYLTHIHQKAVCSDTYFPVLDTVWKCVERSEDREENGITYHFAQYEKGTL